MNIPVELLRIEARTARAMIRANLKQQKRCLVGFPMREERLIVCAGMALLVVPYIVRDAEGHHEQHAYTIAV